MSFKNERRHRLDTLCEEMDQLKERVKKLEQGRPRPAPAEQGAAQPMRRGWLSRKPAP